MTAAVEKLRTAAANGHPAAVADDAWLGGPAEPSRDTPNRPAGSTAPVVAPYIPVPQPLLGGSRWPLILVEGPEYSGKTTVAFELAASKLIGQTYVIAVGEDVDEFGEIAPDALRLPHDGTWHQISGCVDFACAKAAEHHEAGDPPTLIILDSDTKLWELLSEWAETRAKAAPKNRTKLAADPNDEVDIHPTFWNPANKRHRRLVSKLVKAPAIVVITARAKMVAEMGANGNPTGNKVYKVDAQKELGYATTAWIRVSTEQYPTIVGLRRVRGGIQPGAKGKAGEPVVVDPRTDRFKGVEFSLEWLLTHVLKFDPATARVSTAVEPVADNAPDEIVAPAAYQVPVPPGADETPHAGPATGEVVPQQEATRV